MTCSSGSGDGLVVYNKTNLTGNYGIEFTVSSCNDNSFPMTCAIGFSNQSSTYIMIELNNGSYSYISSRTIGGDDNHLSSCNNYSFKAGDTFKITKIDNTVTVYVNNVKYGSVTTNSYSLTGYFGFRQCCSNRTKVISLVKAYSL
jgi:hypothetical protein